MNNKPEPLKLSLNPQQIIAEIIEAQDSFCSYPKGLSSQGLVATTLVSTHDANNPDNLYKIYADDHVPAVHLDANGTFHRDPNSGKRRRKHLFVVFKPFQTVKVLPNDTFQVVALSHWDRLTDRFSMTHGQHVTPTLAPVFFELVDHILRCAKQQSMAAQCDDGALAAAAIEALTINSIKMLPEKMTTKGGVYGYLYSIAVNAMFKAHKAHQKYKKHQPLYSDLYDKNGNNITIEDI